MIFTKEVKEQNFKKMSKQNKVFIVQFVCFAVLFLLGKLLLSFTEITGFMNPLLCAVFATILSPQFKVIKTDEGEKVMMRFLFNKKIKEIKWL